MLERSAIVLRLREIAKLEELHRTAELGNVRYAVLLARRAGVRRREVLNARSPSAFARAVRPSSGKGAA